MRTLLKDINITHISLVKNPATGERVIWKSAEEAQEGKELVSVAFTEIKKSDERRMVFGLVYKPDALDAHGDYTTKDEIEKAAYGFMKNLRLHSIDVQHDFDPKAAFVAESWLTKSNDAMFPGAPEGAWAVGIRVEGEELWGAVKKGELRGLSMAGYAEKVRKEADGGAGGFLDALTKALTGILKKGEEKQPTVPITEAISKEAVEGIAARIADQVRDEIEKAVGEVNQRVEALEALTKGRASGDVDDKRTDSGSCGIA